MYKTAIRADGSYSAADMSGTIESTNGGDIIFAGSFSMDDINQDTYRTTIKTNGNGNIFATGGGSMSYKIIQSAKNFYAFGYFACYKCDLSFINTIYSYGYQSASYSRFNNIDNMYCTTWQACEYSNFNNISNNIIGTGYEALYASDFENIGGTIFCIGYRACYFAIINNTDTVCNNYRFCMSFKFCDHLAVAWQLAVVLCV